MDRFRTALDEFIDKVKVAIQGEPKSPVEILLDQHLPLEEATVSTLSPKNCCSVAMPTFIMNEFTSRSSNVVDYPFIINRIWEVLIAMQHNPHLMKKTLNLLHYLLINGPIQVLKDCQEVTRVSFLAELAVDYNRYEFEQYRFSKHLDIGAGVRKTASDICILLSNESELLRARHQAEKLHRSLTDRGLRSSYPSPKHEISSPRDIDGRAVPFNDETRPPRYTDNLPTSPNWANDFPINIIRHTDASLEESGIKVKSNDERSSADEGSNQGSDIKQQARTIGRTDSYSTNSSVGRQMPKTTLIPSFFTESVDLLGLESPPKPTQCDNPPSNRNPQKLMATI